MKLTPTAAVDTFVPTTSAKTSTSVSRKHFLVDLVQSVKICPVGTNVHVHYPSSATRMQLKDADHRFPFASTTPTVQMANDATLKLKNASTRVHLDTTVQLAKSANLIKSALMDVDLTTTVPPTRSATATLAFATILARQKTQFFNASVVKMQFAKQKITMPPATVHLDSKVTLTKFACQFVSVE